MSNFADHIVNQRFKRVYKELEKFNLIKGKSDIAKKLGTYNHVINSILKGQRNITVDQLNRLFETYGINANYIFGLSEDMFMEGFNIDNFPTIPMEDRHIGGRDNISLVPERAMAGYAVDHQDTTFTDRLPKFSVPNLDGKYIAFEISGDSMLPTITNGDIVICEPLERGSPLRDNQVYVIVTDVVVAKRVQQIREGSLLERLRLISDNGDVYKPYEVDVSEIRQLLKVRCRLTSYAIN